MAKKKRGNKKKTGFAYTKKYPHENHPARYRKQGADEIDYLTFTHSSEVDFKGGKKVKTIPLTDNVSKKERIANKQMGLTKGENKSYVYPKVYRGKRSALGKESDEFSLINEDKVIIDKLFKELPVENVPLTGGLSKYRNRQKKKPRN